MERKKEIITLLENQFINLPDKLIEQYEKRIEQLESEVLFLRALVK